MLSIRKPRVLASLFALTVVSLSSAGSASAANTGSLGRDCTGTAFHGFYRDLSVKKTSCATGRRVMRSYGRRHNREGRPPRRVALGEWTCRLKIMQGESVPYGRVDCKATGSQQIRFYGFS